jgi:hypothetical protein
MFNNSSYKITNTDKLIIKNSIDKLNQDDRKGLNQLIELFSYQEKLIDFIIYYWNSTKFPNSQF